MTRLITLLTLFAVGSLSAADITIPGLSTTTTLAAGDYMELSKNPGSKKISGTNLAASLSAILALPTTYQAKDATQIGRASCRERVSSPV